jgi:tRNA threonylcarbamoyladenosine biosynthesis protein TsaB
VPRITREVREFSLSRRAVLILALDTTTRGGSVAITRDEKVLALHAGDESRTHAERLPEEIDAVLAAAGVDRNDLDLLVAATGPGAFTGLRIGLAAIQGLAMALDRPVVGVSAFDALAHAEADHRSTSEDAPEVPLATWLDAQRGEVYAALYRPVPWEDTGALRQLQAPAVATPEVILAALSDLTDQPLHFVGNGSIRHRALIAARGPNWTVAHGMPLLASTLASIGRRRAAAGHAGPPHTLQPLYVRPPDAELERERRTLR